MIGGWVAVTVVSGVATIGLGMLGIFSAPVIAVIAALAGGAVGLWYIWDDGDIAVKAFALDLYDHAVKGELDQFIAKHRKEFDHWKDAVERWSKMMFDSLNEYLSDVFYNAVVEAEWNKAKQQSLDYLSGKYHIDQIIKNIEESFGS